MQKTLDDLFQPNTSNSEIKKIIETPEGEVEFQANLSNEEVQFLLEFAINSLMKEGAIPFIDQSKIDKISVQEHHPQ